MSKKQIIKRRKPKKLLGIHVIGSGKGESILLELPNGECGIVDCFSPSLTKKHLNQTLRLLADFDVTRLRFICLTHPHEDHFRGITHLLETYQENIEEFWVFPARYIRKVIVHLAV
ncbi:MBL fold metallo-hydrolase [bacterium]|nr:MBL fold metallo-hydrolase [bacterium]